MNNTINYLGEVGLETLLTFLKTKLDALVLTPITSQEITALFNNN